MHHGDNAKYYIYYSIWIFSCFYRCSSRWWGLISTPALLAIGMPPSLALGTNKLASSFGSLTSAIKFIRSGKVDLNIVLKLFPFVFIFAAGGASLATMLTAQILKPLIIIILSLVLIYTIMKKIGEMCAFSKLTIGKAVILYL